jgi:hypothetical protein
MIKIEFDREARSISILIHLNICSFFAVQDRLYSLSDLQSEYIYMFMDPKPTSSMLSDSEGKLTDIHPIDYSLPSDRPLNP